MTVKIIDHDNYRGYTPSREMRVKLNFGGTTLIIEGFPNRQYWLEQLTSPDFLADITKHKFTVDIGIAKCNPRDDFQRKEGIRYALAALTKLELYPTRISLIKDGVVSVTCCAPNDSEVSIKLMGDLGKLNGCNLHELYDLLYPKTDTKSP
jgi:hypothetical protein